MVVDWNGAGEGKRADATRNAGEARASVVLGIKTVEVEFCCSLLMWLQRAFLSSLFVSGAVPEQGIALARS